MITFRAKAARGQLALAPTLAPPTLGRQLKARMSVCDYSILWIGLAFSFP
jgi:hypothetical protein